MTISINRLWRVDQVALEPGRPPGLWFWRDSNGNEVDIIADLGLRLAPIEIKSGRTISSEAFKGLRKWRELAGETAGEPVLIYGGAERYRYNEVSVVGWQDCGTVLE